MFYADSSTLDAWLRDLKHSVRTLVRDWPFTVAAVAVFVPRSVVDPFVMPSCRRIVVLPLAQNIK